MCRRYFPSNEFSPFPLEWAAGGCPTTWGQHIPVKAEGIHGSLRARGDFHTWEAPPASIWNVKPPNPVICTSPECLRYLHSEC